MRTLIYSLTILAAVGFGSTQALAQITADQNPATVGTPVTFTMTGNYSVFYWGVTAGSATPTSLYARSQTFTTTPTAPGTLTVRAVSGSQIQPTIIYFSIGVNSPPPVSFTFSPVSFTYNGSAQGPTITPSVSGMGFSVSGTASATAAGSYSVTATVTDPYNSGSGSANWTIAPAPPGILWSAPAPIPYGTALNATQLNATANVPGSFAYAPPAGTILTAGSRTLSVTFTPADTTDYSSASASVSLTVNKATPVVSWATPAAITYGTALGSTQLNATANVQGTFTYTPAAGTVLATPSQTLKVVFTPTDSADYNSVQASVPLTVNQATPVVSWTAPSAITYPTALSSTQLNATANASGTFAYMPAAGAVLVAGLQTLSATFTPTDGIDYASTSASVPLTVNAQPVSFTISPVSFTYNGSAHGPAITPSVAGATYSTSGTASTTAAGTYSVTATATGNYTGSGSATWTIAPATPVVSWTAPAAIAYGTALSSTQLNATANVPGTFTYTPAAGAVLATGSQILSVTFTPADAVDYASVSSSVSLTVNKATPVASNWPNQAFANSTGYSVKLGDLSAVFTSNPYGSSITQPTGTVTYSVVSCNSGAVAAGTVITAGSVLTPATYTIQASYPGDANYNAATANVTWIITNPVSLTQTSAASSNVFTTNATNIAFGQTATVMGISSDQDNLLVSQTIDYQPPNSTTWVSGSLAAGTAWTGGPTGSDTLTWTIPLATLGNNFGTWKVRAWAANNVPFTSLNTTNTASITYTQATPVVSNWASQAFTVSSNTYAVAAGNLGAVFSNPYNSAVAQPTGTVAYSVVSCSSGAIAAGTVIAPGATLPLGDYTICASYPGDANYGPTTAKVTWTIMATAVVSWTAPAPIAYGTALGSTQLDATASVPGFFAYTPSAGTLLPLGSSTLSVVFTPTDTVDYNGASASVSLTVNKAIPIVTNWASQAFTLSGNNDYAVAAGNLGAAFSNPYNSAVIQPTGTVTYSVVSSGSAAVPTGTVITPGYLLPPGSYTIQASYPGDANYIATPADVTWTIDDPVSTTTASATNVEFGQTVTITGTATDADGLLVSQSIAYLPPPGTTWVMDGATSNGEPAASDPLAWTIPLSTLGNNFGLWQFLAWSVSSVPDTSLNGNNVPLSINYTKATPVVSNWTNQTITFSGNNFTVPATDLGAVFANPYNSSVAQPTGTVTYRVVDAGPIAAGATTLPPGTYTVEASYPGDANYSATTADVTWNVNSTTNPNADSTGDGIPNSQKTTNTYTKAINSVGMTVPGGWPLLAAADPNNLNAVGQTAGSLLVDKSGAATYTIPLFACPGTGGMEPSLSLNYSSSAGAGVAGFGWSLGGLSSITRGAQTRAIDGNGTGNFVHGMNFATSDRYYLDGQRLIAIDGGADGGDGTEYRTEMDTFSRIVSYGTAGNGPAYFKVWTKSGRIVEYGNTPDSAFTPDALGGTSMSWAVDKISDTVGNYMTFTYSTSTSTGEQHIAEIDYTGNTTANKQPYDSIQFSYATRPDRNSGYVHGATVSSTQILQQINACTGIGGGATVVHSYVLDYINRTYTNRSILNDLKEIGADGKAYPPMNFTYSDPSQGWDVTQSYHSKWAPPVPLAASTVMPQGTQFIDLDGDGRPDFVQRHLGSYGNTVANEAWINDPVQGWVPSDGTHGTSDWRLPLPLADDSRYVLGLPSLARLVDFNGDGLPDIIDGLSGSAYLNTGSGWALSNEWTLPGPNPNNYPGTFVRKDIEFIDLNGDGMPDCICWTVNGSAVEPDAWINLGPNQIDPQTGTHWQYAPQYAMPFYDQAGGSIFIDVNGDGLPDEVQYSLSSSPGGPAVIAVALNTGQGWNILAAGSPDFNRFAPPCPLSGCQPNGTPGPLGVQLVDLNGDGLPDIISYDYGHIGANATYFNTGNGWVQAPSYPAMFQLWDSGLPQSGNMGTQILDIEGDGLPAFLCCLNNGASGTINNAVWLNTGSGWSVQTTGDYYIPWPTADLSTTNHSTGADFEDLNGNGGLDELWNGPDENGYNQRGAAINNRVNIDRLTQVTNGMGVSTYITYKPLTDRDPITGDSTVYTKGTGAVWPQTDLIAPMYVVSEADTDDGAGGKCAMTYHYSGLRSDALHGDLGFAAMTVTDSRTLISTTTNYVQDYPFIGLAASTASTQASGAVLTASATTWADISTNYTSNNGVTLTTHFPYASQILQQSYDLNGAFLSSSSTTAADFDRYGNAGTVDVQSLNAPSNPNNYSDPNSYGSSTGYEKKTTSTYANIVAPAPGNWFLGRLSNVQTRSSAPATPPITHIANFAYYPVSGLLFQQIAEPNDPLSLTTTYAYDNFGNITSVATSGAGLSNRTVATAYDSRGQFPVSTTNALNQEESYVYDSRWGVMTSETGPNGLTTTWTYDGMGRKITETRAAGTATPTVTEINYRWANPDNALISLNAPAGPTYLTETETSGAPPSLTFYDNLGRAIYTFGLNGGDFDGNPRIVGQETQYDAMGRSYWTSLPFYYLDTPLVGTQVPEVPTDPTNAANEYDALSRPLVVRTTDEEAPGGFVVSTFAYNGLVTTTINPLGQTMVTTKNSEGQVLSVVTNATGVAATDFGETSYTYDADGNVLSTSVVNSNSPGSPVTTYYSYDLFGCKLTMTDLDRGTWGYAYDAAGELISQTDANKQIVTMTYDVLGRLVTRTEPEGTTTWTYDNAANGIGELASIAVVSTTAANNYSESYIYDSLGRPITTKRYIYTGNTTTGPIEEFDMSQQYDSIGRPTIGTYPGGFQVQNVYNAFGFLHQVSQASANTNFGHDTVQGQVFWQADSYSLWGGVNGCTYGNGVTEDTIVATTTGRVLGFGIGPNEDVAFYGYTHDWLGNITNRNDNATGRNETYAYDGLNRLTKRTLTVNGQAAPDQTVTYDSLGNITSKSDVGAYTYGQHGAGPHAVTAAGNKSYLYDANGNMISSSVLVNGVSTADRNFRWTSFNQASHIDQNGHSSDFTFDADHQRVTQKTDQGVNTVYIGSAFERVTSSSGTDLKYYIFTPAGRSVVRTVHASAGTVTTRYLHQDVLGSIVAVTDETGAVAERYAYDPWGKQSTLLPPASGQSPATSRGFTDHEMLPDLGLIHMNGRIYDPVLGRFLSADSVIQDPGDSQAYNRYSYCSNNPVNAFDPSGHSWFSSFLHFLRKATRDILDTMVFEIPALTGPINRLYAWGESHQQELEIAAIIVASIFTAGSTYALLMGSETMTGTMATGYVVTATPGLLVTSTSLSPMVCSVLATAASGAAGGFVSGAGMESMTGRSILSDFKAGLKGAEFGAISGAISGGTSYLYSAPADGGLGLTTKALSADDWKTDVKDLGVMAAHGLTSALTAKLENTNVRAGFWSGINSVVSDLGPEFGNVYADDLAKGVMGGLSSSNHEGTGFVNGFWNSEAKAFGGSLVGTLAHSNPWLQAAYGSVESGLAGGLKSKLGGTAVSLGARTALYTSLASYGIDGIESSFMPYNPDFAKSSFSKSAGPVGKGYALVQPKTDKKGRITIPLTSIKGGTWANAAPWAQLY